MTRQNQEATNNGNHTETRWLIEIPSQVPNKKNRKYTVTAAICTSQHETRWHGTVEIKATNVAEAKKNGSVRIREEHQIKKDESIQILRINVHTGIFLTGEVDDLIEFSAEFSPDRLYRYTLTRIWNRKQKPAMFIGLNPSTADETKNDPTVRRCINFAKAWGYGGLIMTNAFGLRATSPKTLKKFEDPIGPDNNHHLIANAAKAGIIIAAWGNHASHLERGKAIRELIPQLHHLGITGNGEPKHPLYLPNHTKPTRW